MEQRSFFRTEVGKMSLAGLLVLLAFPLIYLGVTLPGMTALAYVGLGMIIVGMAAAPVMSFLNRKKNPSTQEG